MNRGQVAIERSSFKYSLFGKLTRRRDAALTGYDWTEYNAPRVAHNVARCTT